MKPRGEFVEEVYTEDGQDEAASHPRALGCVLILCLSLFFWGLLGFVVWSMLFA